MAIRIDLEDPLVVCARLVASPEILIEIGQVEQRRHVARIQPERRPELGLRRRIATQIVRVDDAAVEMNFLGLRHTAVQRLLIRGQRCLEAPRLALQQREVVPGVRSVGPA
jgi:hypothetical protein